MPNRYAHWYVLGLFPLAALAFWPFYLAQISTASAQFHAHAITATLWLTLLVAQSWTIHRSQRRIHRTLGLASLVLFPLFLMGGVGIFFGMADRYIAGVPFQAMYAPRLAWLDFVGVGGFAYIYYEALRQRREVHFHSRYMLATAIFLLPPIFGRLSGIPLGVTGPEDLAKLAPGFHIANGLTASIAFGLAIWSGKYGRPFWIAGILTLASAFLYETIGGLAAWEALYAQIVHLPEAVFTVLAGLAGVAIGYAGWIAGRRRATPAIKATA
jgi:hypothetical protein